ncbi:MAG: porin [Gammaproteobacteria bacterium]|nr:porin [Gammaproteobacteria bacterium]
MIPIGAQADASFYGRVNNAVQFQDTGDSTTDLVSVGSRLGFKGESDLGNGMKAHGHYEFATTTDNAAGGVTATRIATAGLSGGFGRIDVGNQWTAYYNATGVHMDPTWTIGPISGSTPFRSPNTIKYSNSVGPLTLEADLRLSDSAENLNADGVPVLSGHGGGVGISIAATEALSFAAAFDLDDQTDLVVTPMAAAMPGLNEAMDAVVVKEATAAVNGLEHNRVGLSGKVSLGQFWASLAWANHEAENGMGATQADKEFVAAYVGMSMTDQISGWVGFAQADVTTNKGEEVKAGHGKEPSKVMAGLYYNLGGGLQLWYEGASEDHDTDDKPATATAGVTTETVTHLVGIRYDF